MLFLLDVQALSWLITVMSGSAYNTAPSYCTNMHFNSFAVVIQLIGGISWDLYGLREANVGLFRQIGNIVYISKCVDRHWVWHCY